MLALSLSDKFCCFGIFVFVFNFNRFAFSRFSFVLVFIIFFVLVLVFVNENNTGWKAHGRLSIRVSLPITVPELRGEMCTARLRRASTSLHLNFTWTGSSPINHSWSQKTRDTGLPDDEDRIPLRSFVLT